MKLKRFNNMNEELTPADMGSDAAKEDKLVKPGISAEDDKFWADANEYNKMVEEYIPMADDPAVRKAVKETTEAFKWEPDEIIAMCYGMLVEINEHDMAKDFVALAKKHHK